MTNFLDTFLNVLTSYLCLEMTFFGWMLLNALTLGLGSLALNPYMNAARAAFYKDLTAPHVQNAEFYNN